MERAQARTLARVQASLSAELRAPETQAVLDGLAIKARAGYVTLVFAARDAERSSAEVLKSVIEELGASVD